MITYLFGAGASAISVPISISLKDSFCEFLDKLKKYNRNNKSVGLIEFEGMKLRQKKHLADLISNAEGIINESAYHQTIDTYARMIYLTQGLDSAKYRKLKCFLSAYFCWVQTQKYPDNRYDHFLASIIDENFSKGIVQNIIPPEITILTWNYDSQFEMALCRYLSGYSSYQDIQLASNIHLSFKSSSEEKFSLLKLNGSSLIYNTYSKKVYHMPTYTGEVGDFSDIQQAVLTYCLVNGAVEYSFTPLINFSWENKPLKKEKGLINTGLYKSISQTHTLIVVGYSFPFFNRKIDQFILSLMINLDKIYLQFKDISESRRIESKLHTFIPFNRQSIKPKIIPLDGADQFHIPYEL